MRTANRKRLILPPTRRKNEVVPNDGTYVSVCLKFPMPLRLRVFEMVETEEHGPHGTRTVKMARQIGGPDNVVVVKGYNRDGIHLQGGIVNADYAVTKNVPAAFWKLWLSQNEDADLVCNHLIWAHKQDASIVSFVREHESNLSGLEPLQPTPPGSPYGPAPKPVDARLKALRFAPTTAAHE